MTLVIETNQASLSTNAPAQSYENIEEQNGITKAKEHSVQAWNKVLESLKRDWDIKTLYKNSTSHGALFNPSY